LPAMAIGDLVDDDHDEADLQASTAEPPAREEWRLPRDDS